MRKFFNDKRNDDLKSEVAFKAYEGFLVRYKSDGMSNVDAIYGGHGSLDDIQKAHLDLLKAKLDMEIANESRKSNEGLQRAAWILSAALVVAAFFELFQ